MRKIIFEFLNIRFNRIPVYKDFYYDGKGNPVYRYSVTEEIINNNVSFWIRGRIDIIIVSTDKNDNQYRCVDIRLIHKIRDYIGIEFDDIEKYVLEWCIKQTSKDGEVVS